MSGYRVSLLWARTRSRLCVAFLAIERVFLSGVLSDVSEEACDSVYGTQHHFSCSDKNDLYDSQTVERTSVFLNE